MVKTPSPWKEQSTQDNQRDKDIKEVQELALRAVDILKSGERIGRFEAAFWRLVDAAGLLSRYIPSTATGREGYPTGLGYSLSRRYGD